MSLWRQESAVAHAEVRLDTERLQRFPLARFETARCWRISCPTPQARENRSELRQYQLMPTVQLQLGSEARDSLSLLQLSSDIRREHLQSGLGKPEEQRFQKCRTDCFSQQLGNGAAPDRPDRISPSLRPLLTARTEFPHRSNPRRLRVAVCE